MTTKIKDKKLSYRRQKMSNIFQAFLQSSVNEKICCDTRELDEKMFLLLDQFDSSKLVLADYRYKSILIV